MSRRTSPRTSEEAEMGVETATHRVVGPAHAAATNTAAESTANLTYVPQEHEPVLAVELIDLLDPRPGETYLDCTFGGGGHARLIAERLGPEGELIAVDRDPASEERWREFAADGIPASRTCSDPATCPGGPRSSSPRARPPCSSASRTRLSPRKAWAGTPSGP